MKKQTDPPNNAHLFWLRLVTFGRKIMQRPTSPLIRLIVLGGTAVGLVALIAASESTAQSPESSSPLQPGVATHETRVDAQELLQFRRGDQIASSVESLASAPTTRSSFMATWDTVSDAKTYLLDVSTDNSFSSYVDGYHDLDVGNSIGRAVTGLHPGTTYYYRVRPNTAAGMGGYSSVTTAITAPATGLVIIPTFDCSIGNDPTIEATIMRSIAIYESLFSDPITIHILFRYSTGGPAPSPSPTATASATATPSSTECPSATPFPAGIVASSVSVQYTVSWNNFISHLRADAKTPNDNKAIASLPASRFSS